MKNYTDRGAGLLKSSEICIILPDYDRKDQYPNLGLLFIENYSYFKTSVDHLSVPGSLADIHFFK